MRNTILALAALVALAGAAQAAEPVIAHTWDEAVTLSKQHGVPVLIDFFTEW